MTSLDEIAQSLIDALSAAEEARWAAGDLLAALPPGVRGKPKEEQPGISLRVLAGVVGRSETYLRNLRLTASTFPPETRALDHPWSVHLLAARSSKPERWLQKAVANGWSLRQLREALIEAKEIKVEAREVCPTCGR